jgi:TetR/AcrR family transcriptional regulator
MVKPSSLSKRSKKKTAPSGAESASATGSGKRAASPVAAQPAPLDTERRILEAARKEFIVKGLTGGRMQVIAAEAGVNKALLHYYYRSKEGLYRVALKDIFQSVWGRLRREMHAQGPAEDLETLVRIFVSTYIRTLASNPDFPLFLFREVSSGGDSLQPVLIEMAREFGEIPATLVRSLQAEAKAGKIRPMQPIHFILNMVGMCVATVMAMPILRKVGPSVGLKIDFDDAFLNDRIEAITSMIFHGIRKKGTSA